MKVEKTGKIKIRKEIIAELEKNRVKQNHRSRIFTEEEDEILRQYWNVRSPTGTYVSVKNIAKALKISDRTCYTRIIQLKKDGKWRKE